MAQLQTTAVTGSVSASLGFTGSFVGSLAGTASYATVAQNVLGSITSASYAATASYVEGSATGGITGSFKGDGSQITGVISSSYAVSASYAPGSPSVSASFATTASAATSITFVPTTASFATTASHAVSASFIRGRAMGLTGSFYINGNNGAGNTYLLGDIYAANGASSIGFVASNEVSILASNGTAGGYMYQIAGASNSTGSEFSLTTYGTSADLVLQAGTGFGTTEFNTIDLFSRGTGSTIDFSTVTNNGTKTIRFDQNGRLVPNSTNTTFDLGFTGSAQINNVYVRGFVSASSFSGSLEGTASYAVSASYAPGSPSVSASYATTASYATVAQNVLGSITSASYAATASAANNFVANTAVINYITGSALHLTGNDTFIETDVRSARPAAPDSASARIYMRTVAGRSLLSSIGGSGLAVQYQPSIFNNNIQFMSPGTAAAPTVTGMSLTTVGTFSHPTPTVRYGWTSNLATGAGINGTIVTASSGHAVATLFRGTSDTGSGGFFFYARVAFPDTAYTGSGGVGNVSGSRIFVGLTDQTMVNVSGNDSSSIGIGIGFQLSYPRGDTTWRLVSRNNANPIENVDTAVTFNAQSIYDFYLFAPPSGSYVGWRVDDLGLSISVSGTLTGSNLPAANTLMRFGVTYRAALGTKNLRIQKMYAESDQ